MHPAEIPNDKSRKNNHALLSYMDTHFTSSSLVSLLLIVSLLQEQMSTNESRSNRVSRKERSFSRDSLCQQLSKRLLQA